MRETKADDQSASAREMALRLNQESAVVLRRALEQYIEDKSGNEKELATAEKLDTVLRDLFK